MAITIKDIARYAGVSLGTVSKVINNTGNVSEELRLRVEAVIEKLDYRPSDLARNIRRNKTNIISLIIPQILNSFYVQVIDLIEKKINDRGYTLLLCNSDENLDTELKYLRTFSTMRIAGLLLASAGLNQQEKLRSELSSYEALDIPVVLIIRAMEGMPFDTVALDNVNGAYKATRYLIENGHKRIGIISSSIHTSASRERIDGYIKALEEYKLPNDSNLIHVGGWSLDSGYQIVNRLLSMANPPTAIFVASNVQMLGAIKALKERGIRIPQDIALICFDDTLWSSFLDPPITVVRPYTETLCEQSIDLLFSRINTEYTGVPRCKVVPTELI
ncbi:MAG: LacI family transcriptional regulator, partial [Spirochaetes bacterium]